MVFRQNIWRNWRALQRFRVLYRASITSFSFLLHANLFLLFPQSRAKCDLINSVSAGCFSGIVLATSQGVKAQAAGCIGFAAFSVVIDGTAFITNDHRLSLVFIQPSYHILIHHCPPIHPTLLSYFNPTTDLLFIF